MCLHLTRKQIKEGFLSSAIDILDMIATMRRGILWHFDKTEK